MNILLTDKCSNNCRYCFAKEKLEEHSMFNEMPVENYRKILEFLKKSDICHVKLLGGEPFLHSNISEIIRMTCEEFNFITIFTGGIFPEDLISLLTSEKINIVLNTNHPSDYEKGKREIFIKNLDYMSELGLDITLGYNIYKIDFDCKFIIELLDYYKIKKLRWAVSVPGYGEENLYIPFKDYKKIGRKLTEFLLTIASRNIEVIRDCFIPFCSFDDSDYGILSKHFPSMMKNCVCEPAIDIGPDLTVWRCFAMSGFENVRLEDFSDYKELEEFFISTIDHYKWHICPEECKDCRHRLSKTCQISCLAFKSEEIRNFISQEKRALSILQEGKELYGKNDMDGGYNKYKESISAAPVSLKTIKMKTDSVLFYIKTGNLSHAKEILEEVRLKYSDSPAIYTYTGLICELEKDYREAIRNYLKALKLSPGNKDLKEKIVNLRNIQIMNRRERR